MDTFGSSMSDNATLLCSIAQDFALEQCVRLPTRGSGGFRGGALSAEAPPFQSPLAFKCTDA